MSIQPWQPPRWCTDCGQRPTTDILCLSCAAELDMMIAAIVGEQPARFDDMLAAIEDAQERHSLDDVVRDLGIDEGV